MPTRLAIVLFLGLAVAGLTGVSASAQVFFDTGSDTFSVAPKGPFPPPPPPAPRVDPTAIPPLPSAGLSTDQRMAERSASASIQPLYGSTATTSATVDLGDDCGPLFADEPWEVRNKLVAFKPVFGKQALDWNEDDYRKVIALAKSCQGQQFNEKSIDGNNWAAMVEFAFQTVLPVAIVARKVEEYGARLRTKEAKLPKCPRILDYVHDDWAMTDNSDALFGLSFMRMSDQDLEKSVQYVNECLLYLPGYALGAKDLRQNDSMTIVNAVMDRALLILKRRQDYADTEKWPHLTTDLLLTIDGAQVMPTMTSQTCREMIERFNRASASKRKFTPETVSTLVRLADQVLSENSSAYDKVYAEAVQAKVQQMIFRRGD